MSCYRGRFAPSPTGPLHFGSLYAAVVSYLDAKANKGSWLVRIEDIDPPRELAGASEQIIKCLQAHHLYWDEDLVYQSHRATQYEAYIQRLNNTHSLFRCPCSRKELAQNKGHSRLCLSGQFDRPFALKFRHTKNRMAWNDLFQSELQMCIEEDFVIQRKDQLYAYQLAVVADDIDQGITHVIRGADLLDSTPMQLALYHQLKASPPQFGHFPLALNKDGQKLSKQNLSRPVSLDHCTENLLLVLQQLGISVPSTLDNCSEILNYGVSHWDRSLLKNKKNFISPIE